MSGEAEIRKENIPRDAGFAVNLLLAGINSRRVFWAEAPWSPTPYTRSPDMATDVVVIAFAKIRPNPETRTRLRPRQAYETLATIIISLRWLPPGILVNSIGAIRVVVDEGCCPSRHRGAAGRRGLPSSRRFFTAMGARRPPGVESSMIANAWHHRSGTLSSLGTLAGIGCAYFLGDKWRIADPIRGARRSSFHF